MNKAINILLTSIWVLMPFVFIGSAYSIIPKFLHIFDDMLEGASLPKLTEIIVSLPLFSWIFVALLFAIFNYYISTKVKNAALAATSFILMIMISGTIIIGLFLPVVEAPIIKLPDEPRIPEPVDAANASNAASVNLSQLARIR